MHRGHQQLLAEVVDLSAAHGLQSLVYTFDCPPEQWFSQQLQLLTDLAAKERLILGHGIDKIITTRFSKEFAGISARSFVVDVLLEQLRAKLVVCGFNFRFGHGAEGEAAYLQARGTIRLYCQDHSTCPPWRRTYQQQPHPAGCPSWRFGLGSRVVGAPSCLYRHCDSWKKAWAEAWFSNCKSRNQS